EIEIDEIKFINPLDDLFKNPCMCFFAIKFEYFDQFMEIVEHYNDKSYIVAKETAYGKHKASEGQHFQCVLDMNDITYHNFSDKVKNTFKLKGTSKDFKKDGIAKQYGKITKKDIKDVETACIYSLKDGDYVSNIEKSLIKTWYEQSFQKKKIDIEALYEYLDENLRDFLNQIGNHKSHSNTILGTLRKNIISYHLEFKYLLPRKSGISDYLRNFLQNSKYIKSELKYEQLELIECYYLNNL
ncbi:hypothetical protein, partial [Flavobacterium sp.]